MSTFVVNERIITDSTPVTKMNQVKAAESSYTGDQKRTKGQTVT